MKHIVRAGWAAQGEINIRSSSALLASRLEPRHGRINHRTQPRDQSKLEINALQGLTAAQRGMWQWGDSAGTVNVPFQAGKGAAATGHAPPGCSRNPGCREGSTSPSWGEGRGHRVVPGTAASVASPRGAGGGTVSRWDRRRGAIAAWHDN